MMHRYAACTDPQPQTLPAPHSKRCGYQGQEGQQQGGGQMKVVSFIEPPQSDVIEEILKHCGLWQASSPRGPPGLDGLVLELDAAYSASSIDSSDQADESQELTYVDIDTFLENF